MTIKVGDNFPNSDIYICKKDKICQINTSQILLNKKTIIFGMPGAFTPTCTNFHIPSIISQIENFKNKGIDEIYCLVVNDIHVTKVWAENTRSIDSGLNILTDPSGKLIKKIGMEFTVSQVGFINRSKRFCLILNNSMVQKIFLEEERSICNITSGQNILDQI